jgi:hypothetical protein
MKTRRYNNKLWALLVAVLLGTMTTSCERDNEVEALNNPYEAKQGESESTTPEEEDQFVKALSAIPGISDVRMDQVILGTRKGYYFKVEQLVDNSDVSKGTFKQLCLLEVNDLDAPVMLYTNGYNLDSNIDNIGPEDIAKYLNANSLYVEHRYFGQSLPEDANDLNFTYFNAQQAAADLHRVVTLLKQYLFNKGNKWVSTGASKCGINTTLYAYYSDLYGWDDIDLYVPFCAPFLVGTPQSPADKSVGTYLKDVCGSHYPANSPQAKAYQYLRAYPSAIANNKALRDACLRYFNQTDSYDYLRLLKDYPNDIERAATAGVLYVFYAYLAEKFAYLDFSDWCSLVPDPTAISTTKPEDDFRLYEVLEFIFMDKKKLEAKLPEQDTSEEGPASVRRRSGYTEEEILKLRSTYPNAPYDIQAVRELGSIFFDFSLLPANSFVTGDYCEQVVKNSLAPVANYGLYAGQWDGGKLMTSVRNWVNTTKKHILFVYGTNDPWTGGAIDSGNPWPGEVIAVNPANANVSKVLSLHTNHNSDILDAKSYPVAASNAIKQALDKYIKSK